jgi:hypothetical protein
MKAEHRKELHTNTLAASMGRLAQTMRHRPRRRTVLWVLLALVVVGGLFVWKVVHDNRARRMSELWEQSDILDPRSMEQIMMDPQVRDSNPGLSVRFQKAHIYLWVFGIEGLASDPKAAQYIELSQKEYARLIQDAKEFPTLAAEAQYNIAVAHEALAAVGDMKKSLDQAVVQYRRVTQDYPKTPWAERAKVRLKVLQDADSRQKIEWVYNRVGGQLIAGRAGQMDLQRLLEQLKKGGKLPPALQGAAPGGP